MPQQVPELGQPDHGQLPLAEVYDGQPFLDPNQAVLLAEDFSVKLHSLFSREELTPQEAHFIEGIVAYGSRIVGYLIDGKPILTPSTEDKSSSNSRTARKLYNSAAQIISARDEGIAGQLPDQESFATNRDSLVQVLSPMMGGQYRISTLPHQRVLFEEYADGIMHYLASLVDINNGIDLDEHAQGLVRELTRTYDDTPIPTPES
jgi:hypothetical protein